MPSRWPTVPFAAASLSVGDRLVDGERRTLGPCSVEVPFVHRITTRRDIGVVNFQTDVAGAAGRPLPRRIGGPLCGDRRAAGQVGEALQRPARPSYALYAHGR